MSEIDIKICGITTPEDAVAARERGADYLGMILSQGFARSILPDEAVDIGLVAEVPLVAVLVDESLDEAERIAGLSGASVIQYIAVFAICFHNNLLQLGPKHLL